MNKSLLVLFGALSIAFGLTSMTSNNAEYSAGKAGSNGSPGEGTCASGSCHNSFALNSGPGSVSIAIEGLTGGNLYVPGQTYVVNVTVAQSGFGLFGFGLEALQSSGANAGSWTPGEGSHILSAIVSGNSRATIAHLDNSGFSSNARTWTFNWTAPTDAIPVTMYAAGNAANANGGDGGDYIYTSTLSLQPIPPLEAPGILYDGDLVLCQNESLELSVNAMEGITYTWLNEFGEPLGAGSTYTATEPGCYRVQATSGSQQAASQPVCVTLDTPDASFNALNPQYCVGDSPIQLIPATEGGEFSGPGVSAAVFNPSQVAPGAVTITHTVVSAAGCTSSYSQSIEVDEIFPSDFTTLNPTYCSTDGEVQITPVSDQGSFTGPIQGNVFTPAIEPGLYTITYTTGSGVCSSSTSQTVEVLPSLSSSFEVPVAFCLSSLSVTMIPTNPGGVFSGTGVSGDSFDPAIAVIGNNEVTYMLIQPNGCISITSQPVAVYDVANSDFTGLNTVTCTTDGLIELIPVSVGGVFSGPGVNGSFFDPVIAGIGEHTIIYDINLGDCQSETAVITTVLEGPDATFTGLFGEYCADADIVSDLINVNSTAVFSGPGVSGNTFEAQSAGVGEHTVTCSVIAANGCAATTTQNVIVHPLPDVSLTVAGDLMSATADQSGATYQWWNCDTQLPVEGATSAEFFITDPSQNGFYSVAVTLNGCDAMSECVLLLIESVEELAHDWSAGFYPNPATTQLNVWSSTPVGVSIYNSLGDLVLSQRVNAMNHLLDISELQQGIYQVVLQTSDGKQSAQLMVKQ